MLRYNFYNKIIILMCFNLFKFMSYDKQSLIPVLEVKEGFDKSAHDYKQYRTLLNSVDNNRFLRFLPRELRWLNILDLWAGDGRIFEHIKNTEYNEYIALDISQKMLDRFQSHSITKICSDCEEDFPIESESIDLVLVFFVIEYIADIEHFFNEISRILRTWWKCIASYSYQRHAFVFWHGEESFKIERFSHRYDQIEAAAENAFLSIDSLPLPNGGKNVWYIYEFKKG